MDILNAIGNTSLVRLRKVVPPSCAQVFAKLEWENPTGSVKDRMAQALIARGETCTAGSSGARKNRGGAEEAEFRGEGTKTAKALPPLCSVSSVPPRFGSRIVACRNDSQSS